MFKVVCRQRGEDAALQATALMQQGRLVELSPSLAMIAVTSLECSLPMADSIILATARQYDAILWTQDEHFRAVGTRSLCSSLLHKFPVMLDGTFFPTARQYLAN